MGAACGVSGTGEALRERRWRGDDGDRTGLGESGLGGTEDVGEGKKAEEVSKNQRDKKDRGERETKTEH